MVPSSEQRNSRRNKTLFSLGLAAALLVMAFAFQGSRGIFTPDEGFYAGIGQAMMETGDYLIPRLQDEPWLDKPPLSLWGIAAGLRLLGLNDWGARAFHATAFGLTILLVFYLARSMGSSREGWLSAVIYTTMPIPFVAANVLTPDSPLTLWTTAAYVCFWKSVEPDARRVALWKLLMCAAFGLAFLTKGPAALVPSSGMFIFLLLQRRVLRYFLTPWFLPGIALFGVLGLGWYAYVARELPGALDYILDNQLIGRTVSDRYDRNPGLLGALIYPPLILGGTLPWSIVWWISLRRRGRSLFRRSSWAGLTLQPADLFLATGVLVPLLVLSMASSKLPLYVLPLFPALAVATARLWPAPPHRGAWLSNPLGFSRTVTILSGLWMIALLGVKLGFALFPMKEDMRALEAALRDRLPEEPYEVISVDEHLESLGLYDVFHVERVTEHHDPYPFFIMPGKLRDKIAHMKTSDYAHVFVCRKDWQSQMVRGSLQNAGISFEESEIPFFHTRVFVCPAMRDEPHRVRLIALGDPGTGRSRRQSIASALHLLDVEKHLNGGVLLLADPTGRKSGKPDASAWIARSDFERLFSDLLARHVPFYTVPGGRYPVPVRGTSPLPPHPPPDRAPDSTVLGDGLVELFFPDRIFPMEQGPRSGRHQRDGRIASLGESRALWKVVALPDSVHGSTRHAAPPKGGEIEQPDGWMDHAGVQIVLQGNRCFLKRFDPDPGTDAPPPPGRPITGPDPDVAFRMLEFDRSTCRVTAFNLLGAPLAAFSLASP